MSKDTIQSITQDFKSLIIKSQQVHLQWTLGI